MRRTTLDGTEQAIDGLDDDQYVVEEFAWCKAPPEWSLGLQVTRSHVPEFMLADAMRGHETSGEDLQGGRLFVGLSTPGAELEGTLVAWKGQEHAVYTVLQRPDVDLEWAARLFSRMSIFEATTGLTLFDHNSMKPTFERRAVRACHEFGNVRMEIRQISPESLSVVPRGRGAEVAGGELWQVADDRDKAVILLTSTAVVHIAAEREEDLMAVATSVQVDWSGT